MVTSYSNPCPICSEERIDRFRLFFDGSIKTFRCTTCGFVGHFPGPGTFGFPNYADSYASSVLPANLDQQYTAAAPRNIEDIIARLAKYCPPPARVLDVGCHTGVFIKRLSEAGYVPHGVEAADAIARYARDKTGLPVTSGLYERTMFGPEEFDVITFLNVFHHMPDPMSTLRAASYHLRRHGLIVIDVPSLQNPVMLLYSLTHIKSIVLRFRTWSAVNNPQIVACYRPKVLSRALTSAGFNLCEIATGRYSTKYSMPYASLSPLLRWVDALCQRFQIGTILAIAAK